MSFPNLVITGSASQRYISGIALSYEDGDLPEFTRLTRVSYDISKEMKLGNVGTGVPARLPDLKYDSCRLVHNWVGFVDVNTSSVLAGDNSTDQSKLNMAIMESAIFYYTNENNDGIQHNYNEIPINDQGATQPSIDTSILTSSYNTAEQPTMNVGWWVGYGTNNEGYVTKNWLIKGINITDNGNNTSRVTFKCYYITPWYVLETIDAAIGS